MRTRAGAALALVCLLLTACARTVEGTPSRVATARLNCARSTSDQIVACLGDSLSRFWTHQLGRAVQLRSVADPSPAQVPADCREALHLHTAFSCPTDDTVYLTAPFLRAMRTTGAAAQAWVRIATTLGHEMGHIVQFAVHPAMTGRRHGWAQSRFIEQQADCLAGVWAASVGIDNDGLPAGERDRPGDRQQRVGAALARHHRRAARGRASRAEGA